MRAVSGEKTGFAYSDELSLLALQQSVTAARGIAAAGAHGKVKAWARTEANLLYPALDPLQTLDKQQKIALLEQMDKFARSLDPAINQVMASISGVYEEVLVAATDGTLAADVRPLVRLSVTVIAEKGDRRERGSAGGGGRFGYDYFLELDGLESRAFGYVREAVRQALVNLDAIDAPYRHHAGGARCRLARCAAARGGGPRSGGISTARAPLPLPTASVSRWLPSTAPSSTTAPCRVGVVPFPSTTRGRRAVTTC